MKNIMKRVVAVICVMTMSMTCFSGFIQNSEVVAADVKQSEPLQLDGFKNVTTSDFKSVSSQKVLQDGTYTSSSTDKKYQLSTGAFNFDKTILSMKIKFEKSGVSAGIYLSGSNSRSGFLLYLDNNNGDKLCIRNVDRFGERGLAIMPNGSDRVHFETGKAGVNSFLNTEMKLDISFEYGDFDNGGSVDDLKIGMYINGNLYENTHVVVSDCNPSALGNFIELQLQDASKGISIKAVEKPINAVKLEGFEDITSLDFVGEQTGAVLANGRYTSSLSEKGYKLVGEDVNMDKKLLSMKVKYEIAGVNAGIYLLGSSTKSGYMLYLDNGSSNSLCLRNFDRNSENSLAIMSNGLDRVHYTAGKAGLDTFLNTEFLLQMSFEYGDFDNGGTKNDLKIGMYINGKLYDNAHTVVYNCDPAKYGTKMEFQLQDASKGISIKAVAPALDEIKPITLEGFDPITITDFKGKQTGNALQAGTYTSSLSEKSYQLPDSEGNMDKKLLSMRVKYEIAGVNAGIYLPGSSTKNGYMVYLDNGSNNSLCIRNFDRNSENSLAIMSNGSDRVHYTAEKSGLNTFLNTEFLLQMSFEYGDFDNGGTKNDLKIGMYINGKLYDNAHTVVYNCDPAKYGTKMEFQLQNASKGISIKAVEQEKVPATPITLEGFDPITITDFKGKQTGNALQAGTYNSSLSETGYQLSASEGNMDKKLLSMRVKYEIAGVNAGIYLLGSDTKNGYMVYLDNGSNNSLCIRNFDRNSENSLAIMSNGSDRVHYTAEKAGLDTFLNTEFLLQVSFEYGDFDNGGTKNDLKIGMYINGKLYDNAHTVVYNCDPAKYGTKMELQLQDASKGISLKAVNLPKQPKPTSVDGFENVTISDFVKESDRTTVLADRTYSAPENPGAYVIHDSEMLNKKLVSMKIKFLTGGVGTGIQIGEKKDTSSGFAVYTNADGSELYLRDINRGANYRIISGDKDRITYSAATAGISSFLNNEFYLQMSFEYGDFDRDGLANDLKVGMYINGKLHGNEVSVINDCNLSRLGSQLTFRLYDTNSSLSLASVTGLKDPTVEVEKIDSNLTQLTFGDFGVRDGKYTIDLNGNPYALSVDGLYLGTTMENIVFNGDVNYSKETVATWAFAGKDSGWRGLLLSNDEDGNLVLKNLTGYKSEGFIQYKFTSDKAGVKLVDNDINVKYSVQFVALDQDGLKNDVKLGVWFDGVLYNNEYYYLGGLAPYIGPHMSIYCETQGASMTVKSVGETSKGPQPEASLKKISFADFGIDNGTYYINKDGNPYSLSAQGTYRGENLDGVLFDGSVLYSKNISASICIGGKDNPWRGLRIYNDKDGNLVMQNLTGNTATSSFRKQAFTSQAAGTQLTGETVDLKMSIQYVDKDGDGQKNDVKLGVWFNGYLYGNQYIYLDNLADSLGTDMGIYCETDDTSVTVNSYEGAVVVREMPNAAFKKITFSHFGISDGSFEYDDVGDFNAVGRLDGIGSIDRTVFCGDLLLKKNKNAVICIGGKDNIWYGIRITIRPNGKIGVSWIGDQFNVRYKEFGEATAQTPLYDQWVNMMMSTEIVDGDGDGLKDDIKLGFWFNGRLYEGEYIIIPDKATELGTYMGIFCGEEGATLSVRSVNNLIEPFNFARYGLDSQWKNKLLDTGMKGKTIVGGSKSVSPFTGDVMKIATGVILGGLFSMAIIGAWVILKRRGDV